MGEGLTGAKGVAIEIENLTKSYSKSKGAPIKAVDGLNLSVPAGEIFGLLGPNGAGKTTTIKIICGLIIPASGSVRVRGFDVACSRRESMQQIGAVLEGTRNVYWRLTAWENIKYFGRLKGCHGRFLRERSELLLRGLELWERRNEIVQNFSRGMQQKLAIACALVADPPVLLLDEPTLGLDAEAAQSVKTWISRLSREQGKTIVLTTHQLDLAEELCTRVAILVSGKLVANLPVAELLHLSKVSLYRVRFKGKTTDVPDGWPKGWNQTTENGDTILTGSVTEGIQLHRVLDHLRDRGLQLISVNSSEPGLQEVYFQLMESERKPKQAH